MRSLQGRGKKQTWNVWPLLRYQDPKLCPQQEDDLGHCLSPTPEPPQAPVLLGARVATPCLLQLPHSLIQTLSGALTPRPRKKTVVRTVSQKPGVSLGRSSSVVGTGRRDQKMKHEISCRNREEGAGLAGSAVASGTWEPGNLYPYRHAGLISPCGMHVGSQGCMVTTATH